jgi:perosamine synthetase
MPMDQRYKKIILFIREVFESSKLVPLHAPVFIGKEKEYLSNCIESTYVSYLGEYVTKFEQEIAKFTGIKYAVATVNGTCALQIALQVCGVKPGDEVLTQALTFVATANAISHTAATPVFIDSDRQTLGMSPEKLEEFLVENTYNDNNGFRINIKTGKRISACVPVHVFGHPVRIDKIVEICKKCNIFLVEDAAESLGSYYKGNHTGLFGEAAILSFNGNKIITSGGGGMILTSDESLAEKARHLTTTAKVAHPYEFYHDEVGYNYRMTNITAALGLAQMENILLFLRNKRELAIIYSDFFKELGISFITEPPDSKSNYWLNTILLNDRDDRDNFLNFSHQNKVMCRPAWMLMNELPMYRNCTTTNLENARYLQDRMVNIPSSVRIKSL